jgi:hypothetical protein
MFDVLGRILISTIISVYSDNRGISFYVDADLAGEG